MIPPDIKRSIAGLAFRYHPERESIIDLFMADDYTIEDLDRWFDETNAACASRILGWEVE